MGYHFPCEELDELFGYIDEGCTLLIEGPPGAGKTIFALSLAYRNARLKNSRILYMSLNEDSTKLLLLMRSLGMDVEYLDRNGVLKIIRVPMAGVPELAEYVSKTISENFERYDIVVIDSVTPLMKLLKDYPSKRAWLQNVLYELASRSKGILVVVADILEENDPDIRLLEYVADIVIQLDYRCRTVLERAMIFKKFRGHEIKLATIPFEISSSGIIVLNHVASTKIRRDRKPLVVDNDRLRQVLPPVIEPGTAILIVGREISFSDTNFYRWLHDYATKLLEEGYRIAFLTYNPRYVRYLRRVAEERSAAKNLFVKYLDPLAISPNIVIREEIELCTRYGIDLLFILDIEKLFHAHRHAETYLYRYESYAINALRKIGVTAIRYINLDRREPIPAVYMDWCDIVLEIAKMENGEIALVPLVTYGVRSPSTVLDREIL